MKILLLNPPTPENQRFIREGRCTQEQGAWAVLWPPITLASVAAVLRKEGHEISLLDGAAEKFPYGRLRELVARTGPDLVCFASATPSIESDLQVAGLVKSLDAKIATATFGTHASALAEDCLNRFPGLDFVVRNEPEITIRELAKNLQTGGNPGSVLGITYRDGGKIIRSNSARPFLEDLDALPMPAWDLINLSRYQMPLVGEPFLMVAPIRGCPYLCTFCTCQTYYGAKIRKASPRRVVEEIRRNMIEFGVRNFFFWADTFTIDRGYTEDLCRALVDARLDIRWTCNSRIDTVNEPLLRLMKEAGCWMLSFGIESFDQGILNGVKKGLKSEKIAPTVEAAKRVGLKVVGHIIFGLPGETETTLAETRRKVLDLDLDFVQFYCAAPFPGSELYNQSKAEGWIDGNHFHDFRQDRAILELPDLPAGRVELERKKAFRQFYLRPKTIRTVFGLINWGRLSQLGLVLRRFISWTT